MGKAQNFASAFCLEELRTPNLWGTEGSAARSRVDGLDSWLGALVRQPDTENLSAICSRRVAAITIN